MQRGDRRGARAARTPRSSSPAHPCASMRLYKPPSTCALGVWAVAYARVCEGVGREGKQKVLREEGMGEADGVIAGYTCQACVSRVFACVCARMCSCACIRACFPCVFVCLFDCVCVCVRACLHLCMVARHDACSVQTITCSGGLSHGSMETRHGGCRRCHRRVCSVCVCMCLCNCVRVFAFICACVHCVFVCLCAGLIVSACVCVRACLHLYTPHRGLPRHMQRADHHRLFQST
jgi:hypothetical protein